MSEGFDSNLIFIFDPPLTNVTNSQLTLSPLVLTIVPLVLIIVGVVSVFGPIEWEGTEDGVCDRMIGLISC